MNSGKRIRRSRNQGFSLLELLVVVAILTLVVGVIFQQVSLVQKRYRTEESKLDLSQESREFVDQIVRDVRQAGFPGQKVFAPAVLGAPWQNDSRVAVGLVSYSNTDLWFEGDVDGDGAVESVRYTLRPGAAGSCPCTLQRSQVVKINATAPMAQITSYSAGLDGVVNSGGLYTIGGSTPMGGPGGGVALVANNTIYGALAGNTVFQAFDVNGAAIGPCDINSDPITLARIKSIGITLNVLVRPAGADFQTRMRPALSINASAKLTN